MTGVSLLAALGAGVLALVSPCAALLLPAFFAYAFTSRSALLARTAVFYAGLLLTLVPLGSGAAWASRLFYGHRPLLVAVAGWTLIALGVFQAAGGRFALPFAGRLQGYAAQRGGARAGVLSTLLLGAVYGLAGFCSGPVLGAILTVAMTSGSPVRGGLLLAVYALGMAVPLFVLALLWDRLELGRRTWLRGRELRWGPLRTHTSSVLAGVLFAVLGVLFLRFEGTASLGGLPGLGDTTGLELRAQTWLLESTTDLPLWPVPLAVAVVAATVAWRRLRRPSG